MKTLIEEVRKRNILWEKSDTKYRDHRAVIDLEWQKVSKKCGISKEDAKKRWRNLRDQFTKEFKKIPSGTSSRNYLAVYPGKWHYFKSLVFLGDTIILNETEVRKSTMPTLIRENDETLSSVEDEKQDLNYMIESTATLCRSSPKFDVLINEVRKTNVLWDKTSLTYEEKLAVNNDYEWDRVAKKCGLLKEDAKKKWRNLRDQFIKEFKKIPSGTSSQKYLAAYPGKWHYFESLLFLGDTIILNETEVVKPTTPTIIEENDETVSSIEDEKQHLNSREIIFRNSPKIEVLINEVRKTKILWDRASPTYKDKHASDNEWDRVAKKCRLTKEQAKKKWRNLRDQFAKEYRRVPTEATGDPDECVANYPGRWKHFKSLLFLRDLVTPQDTEQNISTKREMALIEELIEFPKSEEGENAEEIYTDEWSDGESDATTYSSSATDRQSKKRILPKSKNADNKSKKLKLLETEKNENLLFLTSLVPYFEKLNTIQQLRVRSKFQNILIEAIENS